MHWSKIRENEALEQSIEYWDLFDYDCDCYDLFMSYRLRLVRHLRYIKFADNR